MNLCHQFISSNGGKGMKYLRFFFLFVAIVGLMACAKPPQAEIDAVNAALDEAKNAEAEIYAPDSLKAAQDAISAMQAELDVQNGKFALFRSYEKAKELANAAKDAAVKAKDDAAANKEQVKSEAETLMNEVQTALTEANDLMKKAPKGKGSQADLAALQADLDTVQPMIDEAKASFDGGKFMDAKTKLEEAKAKVSSVKDAITNAIEMAKGKKK